MCAEYEQIKNANIIINSLCIFKNLKEDSVLKKYSSLLEYLNNKEVSIEKAISFYNDFIYELNSKSNVISFKKYIIDLFFLDNNAFTEMIDNNNLNNEYILKQVQFELKGLQYISNIKAEEFKEFIITKCKANNFQAEIINSIMDFEVGYTANYNSGKVLDKLKLNILNSNSWCDLLEDIIEFYKKYGTGIFGEYRAFVWEHQEDHTYLRGVKSPDPVRLEDLSGYEDQKEVIIKNTKQFLNGYPANNILLYGSRGTGKSSTVKAIINEYYNEGLRLIQVNKDKLVDFVKIIKILKNKNLKFIIFVDDLVFQEGEEGSYSALKTILEGGVENKSNNILIYATTNRQHLVKESFSERGDDIHENDSIEEKLSLADRFGITVSFYSPNQKEYLSIVDNIIQSRGIEVDKDYLHAEAVKWVRWYNARSPRTAMQFVNWLQGELKK